MRSRTAIWFECKIAYEKVMEDGLQKKVKENYVVDALSFTEAESRIMEEMSSYISGEFTIEDIKIASYKEIFFSEEEMADRWYKAKLQFITIDVMSLRSMTFVTTRQNSNKFDICSRCSKSSMFNVQRST